MIMEKTINFSERDMQTIYLALRKAPMPFDETAPVIQKVEAFFASVVGPDADLTPPRD